MGIASQLQNGGVIREKPSIGRASNMPTMRSSTGTENLHLSTEPEARDSIETSRAAKYSRTATCWKAFFRMQ